MWLFACRFVSFFNDQGNFLGMITLVYCASRQAEDRVFRQASLEKSLKNVIFICIPTEADTGGGGNRAMAPPIRWKKGVNMSFAPPHTPDGHFQTSRTLFGSDWSKEPKPCSFWPRWKSFYCKKAFFDSKRVLLTLKRSFYASKSFPFLLPFPAPKGPFQLQTVSFWLRKVPFRLRRAFLCLESALRLQIDPFSSKRSFRVLKRSFFAWVRPFLGPKGPFLLKKRRFLLKEGPIWLQKGLLWPLAWAP